MQDRKRRSRLAAAALAVTTAAGALVAVTAAPAQASARYGYSGFSHGTLVVSGLVNSGPQVASFFGCTRTVGIYRENHLATVNGGGAVTAHTVTTKTYTHNDSRGDGTTSYGTAADISIGPLLQLSGAQSFARAVHTSSGFQTTAWTRFGSVKIAGVPLPNLLNPAPNTTVNIPGLGYAQFNRVELSKTAQSATAKTVAVLIKATMSNPYLPNGATIGVLPTGALVGGPSNAVLRGKAYATQVNVGNVVKSGPTSLQTTCFGTNGALRTVSVLGLEVPGVASVGALTTKHAGTLRTDLVSGNMTALVGDVSLGGGRIKLGAVSARTSATKTAAGKYYVSSSSSIGSLVIDGRTVPIPPAPNQTLTVPGLAVLTFNKTSKTFAFISLTAVEIKLTALNTTVEIAHAESGIVN